MISVNPIELYDFLASKNYRYFFHANTVTTSCTLIRNKGLISRGFMKSNSFPFTIQSSDEIDKKFNVWNDIFF